MKEQPRIIEMSSCADNGQLFTLGLGYDNKVYIWNPVDCFWMLHQVQPQAAMQAPAPSRQQRRHNVQK